MYSNVDVWAVIPHVILRGVRPQKKSVASPWWDVDLFCTAEALSVYLGANDVLLRYFHMNEFDDVFAAAPAKAPAGVRGDPEMCATFPRLGRLLTYDSLPSGQPRQTSTIIIVYEDGTFKAGLRDRESEKSMWVSAESVNGLLEAFERALAKPNPDWRAPKKNKR